MIILSFGNYEFCRKHFGSFGLYQYKEVSCDVKAEFVLPVLGSHEEYEQWVLENGGFVDRVLNSLQEKPVCLLGLSYETGVFLVFLEALQKKFGSIDVILFTQMFGAPQWKRVLSRLLYGVLYNFINNGISKLYWFSFDIMRKLYRDLRLLNQEDWYSKSISLFHKVSSFEAEKAEVELSGDVVWDSGEYCSIEKTPKLIILSERPLTEEVISEQKIYIYKVVYFITSYDENVDQFLEEELEKKTEVIREYKVYSFGSEMLEYFVIPCSM
ncbi:MAG: hypothetical protein N3A54_03940 [Patescibacteria group bacterium]|nr:hypothetical protein [Patescibacteria group bacterium]